MRRTAGRVMTRGFDLWYALPRVVPYLRPYRRLAVTSVLITFASALVALAGPWPLAILVDSVLGDVPPAGFIRAVIGDEPYTLLTVAVTLGFLITVASHGLNVLTDYVNVKIEQRMVLDLRSDLFEHCQRLSLAFHDARLTGEFMSKINFQSSALGAIVMAFPPLAESLLTLVGMLVVALFIDWQVALASLVVVPFIYYSFGLYGTRIVPRLQRVQGLEWQSLSIVHEAMAMLRVIIPFNRERYEHRRFREQGETAVDERVKLTVRQTAYTLGVSTATAAGTALVLGFGATHVLQGQLTVGELLVLLTYIAAIYKPLEAISATVGSLHEQFVYFNASLDLLETEPEVKEAPDAIALERTRGEVTFDHVGFAYQGRVDTLKDVTFRVEPGERVAIVGPTGAGKTTLVSLLIRFYDPQQGSIRLDGIDTRRLTLESLRSQVAVVLQEPLLFSGTIAENIRYGRLDATTEELEAAARAANAHEFITRLPQGYQTELGERGAQLSGGERQRLAIARAFLKDAPIIVLDEPTSSIDSRTEAVILDALEDLTVGRTSFVIAHRLSTVRHADRILVMNHGELVEQGTHEELLEQGGMYRHLHEAQNRPRVRRFAREAAAVPAGAAAAGGADPPTTNGNGTGRGADGVGREPSDRHEGDGEHAPGPPPPSAAPVADGAVGVATPARRRARRRRPLALALAALAGVGGSAAAGGLLPSGDDSAPTSRSPASTSAAPRPESSPATASPAPERPPVERRDSGSPGVEELWEEYPLEPGGP